MGTILWSKRHDAVLGRNRAKRPKTFKTEESAITWAKKHNVAKYHVENMHPASMKHKKFRVLVGN